MTLDAATDRRAAPPLDAAAIAGFWAPLAATWVMMAAEGPFVAALIARLPEARNNLAAFGVALPFGMLIEAPVIMIMSAATALVRDRASFLQLRRFTYALNVAVTLAIALLVVPPVFRLVAERLIGLPPEVARLAHLGTALLIPWPAAIGYRRFFQGILIRHGLTRLVAVGTVVRLATMAAAGTGLALLTTVPGVVVGAAALSAGVVAEAAASRVMARRVVRRLRSGEIPAAAGPPLTMAAIVAFYTPLALTSLITLGAHPLITFFVGRSRLAVDSLAVLPVVTSSVFIVRAPAIAFQEVGIALLGPARAGLPALRRFAAWLGAALTGVLALVAFTPLAGVWFGRVAGLTADLVRLAVVPTRILVLMPALEVLLALQRALLVDARATRWITAATAVEVGGLALVMAVAIGGLDAVGAVAAAAAGLSGRLLANAVLLAPAAVRVGVSGPEPPDRDGGTP